mmetsp:Transcript_10144/g.17365  ORF Transcript_10144/g.17365 Transcript_10144/m.17365 type:complete len:388 (+) Transcript_10144:26-1189(+)
MDQNSSISPMVLHGDLVHDIAYDYYGDRVATCSSDRTIKVWQPFGEAKSQWECCASWNAHEGSILSIAWAPPHICGPGVLASSSTDRKVVLWEERRRNAADAWLMLAQLVDSRDEVRGVAFSAGGSTRVYLASASADGVLRIYEAVDPANLHQWPLVHEMLAAKSASLALNCVQWCASTIRMSEAEPNALVVGADGTCAFVWSSENENVWKLAVMLDTSLAPGQDVQHDTPASVSLRNASGSLAGSMPIVSPLTAASGTQVVARGIPGNSNESDAVLSVSWALNVGREYHLIAVGTRSGKVCVFAVDPEFLIRVSQERRLAPVVVLTDHQPAKVQRVAWNITGTLLASSDDNGNLKIWQPALDDMHGEWKCMGMVNNIQQGDPTNAF